MPPRRRRSQIWDEDIGFLQLKQVGTQAAANITFAYSAETKDGGTYETRDLAPAGPDITSYPAYPLVDAQIWINAATGSTAPGNFGFSTYGLQTFLHEIGHALGLSHPGNYNATDTEAPDYATDAVYAQDTRQYSIMSYFGADTAKGWSLTGGGDYSSTPMVDDLATIQSKYGANWNTRNTNTVYGFNSTAGEDFYDFSKNKTPVFTIWDGGGNDTIDASGWNNDQTIDLTPGAYSSVVGLVDNVAVALQAGGGDDLIENAIGGDGDDTLTGNSADNVLTGNGGNDTIFGGSGNDTLLGGAGDDRLDGGGGRDILTGGSGTDTFVYQAGYGLQTVTDFSTFADQLDLTKTNVHDWADLLGKATQSGNDTLITFNLQSTGAPNALLLQGVSLDEFETTDPGQVAFSPDMTPVFAGFSVVPDPDPNFVTMYVSVAPLADGGFLATRFSTTEVADKTLIAFRYDAHGVLVDSVQVNTTPSDALMVRAIGLGSGKILVIWDSPTGSVLGGHAIRGRILDANGNPLGADFQVNSSGALPDASQTGDWAISLTASSSGGAVVTWYGPSYVTIEGVPQYHVFDIGVDADGGVVGTDRDIGPANGIQAQNAVYVLDSAHVAYWQDVGADGKLHAYYTAPGTAAKVQIDNGDYFPDAVSIASPQFQAIQLADGRVMFEYLSGFISGYTQRVNSAEIVIVNPGSGGFTKPGTAGDDTLVGGPGPDQLYGLAGNDTLEGNGGGDLLDGGPGTDTATYDKSLLPVTINLTLTGPQAGTGDGAGDTLVSIENLTGSAYGDTLTGDAGANLIDGGYGNDTISGGGGADTLMGGAGADIITLTADTTDGSVPKAYGGNGNDVITINGNGGEAYGEAGADTLYANGNGDTLDGGDGNNVLRVLSEAPGPGDRLYGGSGADALQGGAGDDTLIGGTGGDFYGASGGHDTYYGAYDPNDTLIYAGDFANFAMTQDVNGDLIISDLRAGAPEGVSTVSGIERFYFRDGHYSFDQLIAMAPPPAVPGLVSDGYIAGATVFLDENGDGVLDDGEASSVSDGSGQFALPQTAAQIIATGGTDIATGLTQTLPLSAPAGSTVVTPLTTLIDARGGSTPSDDVTSAFGLDVDITLSIFDPISAVTFGDPGASALFAAGTKAMNVFVAGTDFVAAVSGASAAVVYPRILAAIAGLMGHGLVDLADAATIGRILTTALAGGAVNATVLANTAMMIAAVNAAADAHVSLTGDDLLVVESAIGITAQNNLAAALAIVGNDPVQSTALVSAYTGSALDALIAANQARVGSVDGAPCFCAGTQILTDRGLVAVQDLAIGDAVVTVDGGMERIRWIGERHYAAPFIAGNEFILPVRFAAGALADGVPARDLWVSPGHAMFIDGALVPAWRLLNGVSIVQPGDTHAVSYYHVELHRHAVLLAEGAAAESFLDDHCRNQFHNAASFHAAHGDAPPLTPLARRLEDGVALQIIQDRLAARAGVVRVVRPIGRLQGFIDQAGGRVCGWAQDCDSPEAPVALEICVGGRAIRCVLANAYRADLREAGVGSGCHAFDVTLAPGAGGAVSVRRMADGAMLPLSCAAVAGQERLAA